MKKSDKHSPLRSDPELRIGQKSGGDDAVRKHRAGALFRVNLPPLMGRRDAVLDAAETLIRVSGKVDIAKRETLYSYLHGLFAAADSNTSRISGMFNNHDTVAREQRLTLHIGVLAKLSASLDEFCMLKVRMLEAALLYADDPTNEFDTAYTEKVNERLLSIEENLLAQLCEYFERVRERIARYRLYAVKNFSREYLERYRKSYQSVINRCNEAFELFSVKIPTQN